MQQDVIWQDTLARSVNERSARLPTLSLLAVVLVGCVSLLWLAEDLPALTVHLAYPLRLRKRLRSTNLLERSLEEVRRRTKVIGRFPGETSCLTMAWAVMDLVIAGGKGLGLSLPERHAIAAIIAERAAPQTHQRVA